MFNLKSSPINLKENKIKIFYIDSIYIVYDMRLRKESERVTQNNTKL